MVDLLERQIAVADCQVCAAVINFLQQVRPGVRRRHQLSPAGETRHAIVYRVTGLVCLDVSLWGYSGYLVIR